METDSIDPNDIPEGTLLKYAIRDIRKYRDYTHTLEEKIKELESSLIAKDTEMDRRISELKEEYLTDDVIKSFSENEVIIGLTEKVNRQRKELSRIQPLVEELKTKLKTGRSVAEAKEVKELVEEKLSSYKSTIATLNSQIESMRSQLFDKLNYSSVIKQGKLVVESRYENGKDAYVEGLMRDVSKDIIVILFFDMSTADLDEEVGYYKSLGVDYIFISIRESLNWLIDSLTHSYTMDGGESETLVSSIRLPKSTHDGVSVDLTEKDKENIKESFKGLVQTILVKKLSLKE